MDKKHVKANHSSEKEKDKGKHPLMRISAGLSKAQADRLAKHKMAKQSK
ncbi:hypothetical protein ACQKFG_05675 [Peribacillus sp. NPDC076916]